MENIYVMIAAWPEAFNDANRRKLIVFAGVMYIPVKTLPLQVTRTKFEQANLEKLKRQRLC